MSNPSLRLSGYTWRGFPAASALRWIASWRGRPSLWPAARGRRPWPPEPRWDMPVRSCPCPDGPVHAAAAARGRPCVRSQVTAVSAAPSAAQRIRPWAMPGQPFPARGSF